ncbi:uncharacterized protein LOC107640934 [Arachis ipaensis]|uniref:uncharacterized protein LOC107640934 n=1 Tax=Arachis ipaensis TaxID=130454 RepID=UPI0007AF1095|nr:uncharacterized protein LOC107640934 [Arachis ipaensis]
MQELRHRMQDLERRLAERERDQRSPERSPTRSRSRSRSRRTPSPQGESESTEERIRPRRRSRDPIIYARHERRRASNRGNEERHRENDESRRTVRGPVIIGATPFHRSDALEQAIRDGKLVDFSHLIREPRRRNRDNDNEDRSRPTRRRQEPEGDDHGLTVVNVVTARNTAPRSKSAQKKDAKVLAISAPPGRGLKGLPPISFGPEDQWFDEAPESPPMVITARVRTGLVKRILVDTGADSNIMFRNVFDALGLRDSDLTTHQHGVVGLGDHFIKPDGIITLPTSVGQGQRRRTIMADFVILRDSTAYNIILGRKTINDLGAAISTKLLVMKFITDDGSVGSLRGDLETAVACDHTSLSLRKKSKEASGVFLADLDARVDDKPRPEPEGDLEKFRVGEEHDKFRPDDPPARCGRVRRPLHKAGRNHHTPDLCGTRAKTKDNHGRLCNITRFDGL